MAQLLHTNIFVCQLNHIICKISLFIIYIKLLVYFRQKYYFETIPIKKVGTVPDLYMITGRISKAGLWNNMAHDFYIVSPPATRQCELHLRQPSTLTNNRGMNTKYHVPGSAHDVIRSPRETQCGGGVYDHIVVINPALI